MPSSLVGFFFSFCNKTTLALKYLLRGKILNPCDSVYEMNLCESSYC